MEQGNNNFLNKLFDLPNDTNINYSFKPLDNSIMKVSWNSPNDRKPNLFNLLMSNEPYFIRIKDNH